MIHPGTGIDVRSKPGHGVGEPVVVIQGIPEGREVVADIIQLGGAGGELELVFPRINQGHRLIGCENPRISRVQTVDLHEVTAGQRGQREVLRLQSPGIDPVLAHLDPVHQHINARVTGRVDRPGARTHKIDLHKAGIRRVAPDVPAELVHEGIMNEHRLEVVRSVHHPVAVGGHSQGRQRAVVVPLVTELQPIAGLFDAFGAGAANGNAGPRGQGRSIRQPRHPVRIGLEELHVSKDPSIGRRPASTKIMDEHHRQVRTKIGHRR